MRRDEQENFLYALVSELEIPNLSQKEREQRPKDSRKKIGQVESGGRRGRNFFRLNISQQRFLSQKISRLRLPGVVECRKGA
jgi:uncharacterized sporulation protein YeaH/YhbH (DUF444 family)